MIDLASSSSSEPSCASDLRAHGFVYEEEAIGLEEEQRLIAHIEQESYYSKDPNDGGRGRIFRYGWSYSTNPERLGIVPDWVPCFWPERCGKRACTINVYSPSQGIVRHSDLKVFDGPVGVLSLGSPATLVFERLGPRGMMRVATTIAPRSFYTLDGVMRSRWLHSIEPVASKRYSVVYRTRRAV